MGTINHNTTGVFYDVPDPDYRKAPGVSNSMLKALRERWNPEHARARLAKPKETTEALAFGKALHGLLLTPDVTPTWVVLPEDAPKRPTKKQLGAKKPSPETLTEIEWWKNFDTANKGLDVLDATGNYGGVQLAKTVEKFRSHSLASEALKNGRPEVSVFTPYNLGGSVMRKMRTDFVCDAPTIIDLKSSMDCSPGCIGKRDEFAAQLYDLDYDMQAAYYLDLWNDAKPDERKEEFVFIAMDWDDDLEIVGIRVMQCPPHLIKSGRDKYVEAIAKWIECETSGKWGGYAEHVTMLNLPDYIAKRYKEAA